MGDFDERLQILIDNPSDFNEDEIDELFDIADGDSDRMIALWCAIPQDEQFNTYREKFKEVTQLCGDDLDKKIQVWSHTSGGIQFKNGNFIMPELQTLALTEQEKALSVLKVTTPATLATNSELTVKIIHNINTQPPNQMLVFLLNLPEGFRKKDEFSKEVMRIAYYFAEENPSVDNLVSLYANQRSIDNIINDMDGSVKTPIWKHSSKIKEELMKNPNIVVQAIEEDKIKIIDEDMLDAIITSNPPQSNSSIMQVLKKAKYFDFNKYNDRSSHSIFLSSHCVDAFKLMNSQMKSIDDFKLAFDMLRLEMQAPESQMLADEIGNTLSICDAYCHYTKDYSSAIKAYVEHHDKLENLVDKYSKTEENKEMGITSKKGLILHVDNLLNHIKRHPDQILETIPASKTIEYFGVENFLNWIDQLDKDGKDTSRYLGETLNLTTEQYKTLLKATNIPQDLNIQVTCKNASEMSVQDLEDVKGRFTVQSIKFEDENLSAEQTKPYSLEEYKMCREKIDELLESVVMPPESDTNREKNLCTSNVKIG